MLNIAIIIGSTRPGRKGEAVAHWIHEHARSRKDARFEILDLLDFELPLLDEPKPPSMGTGEKPHTKKWSAAIQRFDAFVFVTPEYNHGTSGALKNAIDFLNAEWRDKAAGFVSYGSALGVRAVEHLRLVMGELQVADVRAQVAFSIFTDFEKSEFAPADRHLKDLTDMLDQLISWGTALRGVRTQEPQLPKENGKHGAASAKPG
jgi:NAD(P)H-dependent FMN reductase